MFSLKVSGLRYFVDSAMLLLSSCVPVITWLCSRAMRFHSRPKNWPMLAIESSVAQWLEHPTRSRRVVGSNPTWDSNFFRVLLTFNKHKLKVDCNMISFRSCLKSSLIPVLAERQIISWKQTSHHVTQTSRADWVIASGFVSETKQSLQGLGNFS